MNLLKTIIDRLNQRVEVANIFDQIYSLCELNANGNEKAWVHYIGNGQAEVVTNFDAKQGTLFWAKRGKVSVVKTESFKVSGCKTLYQTTFPLTAYAVVRKSHLPCDSEDSQDWIASRIYRLISGTDPDFKSVLAVISYEVIPNGYVNEIKSLTANYEWACVAVDVDVAVVSASEDGCYDVCATGDIPLPDFEPCQPCLTEVAVDGVTITGNGTTADPLVAVGGGGGSGLKTAIAFSNDHLIANGNQYQVGNVVWYNGNIYRCIANNDSILPTNATYWTNLGAGFQTIERPIDWNATSGNNQILNKPTIPNTPSLEDVVNVGNTTSLDISFGSGVGAIFNNGAKVKEGTTDAGLGGAKGVAMICSNAYELKWEAGRLYYMEQDGFTIREVTHNFTITPSVNDDSTKGFVVGSRWVLDNGDLYILSDDTIGAAVWNLQSISVPSLQDVTDVDNTSTNDILIQGANDFIGQVSSQAISTYNTVSNAYAEITVTTNGQLTLSDGTSAGILSVNNLTNSNVQLEFPNKATGNYTIATTADIVTQVNSDWNASSGVAEILNKPTIPAAQIQSDWNQSNNVALDYIKNKPTIPQGGLPSGGTAGQILTKIDSTDYNATWQENYADWTSVVKHIVKNNGASGTITKGTAVYVTGSNGTNMLVGRASNASEATSSKTMGLMESDITTTGGTQTGFVITEGLLGNLNTAGTTAGDPVWLGVNGALIYGLINKPYAPAHLVFIGIVTKVSSGNGEIFVKVQNGFELKEIHDVDLITTIPINGHILGFDGTLWVNKTIATWLGFTPVTNARTISTTAPLSGGGDLTANRTFSIAKSTASVDGYLAATDFTTFAAKQDALVSGTNIKTINSNSLLGSGNITIAVPVVYKSTTDTATITGITNQLVASQLIPANTFAVGDIIKVLARYRKSTTLVNMTTRIYVNSANNLTGALLLGTYGLVGLYSQLERNLFIKSATNTETFGNTSSFYIDSGTGNAVSSTSVDWTINQYIIFAAQQTVAGETTLLSGFLIEKL